MADETKHREAPGPAPAEPVKSQSAPRPNITITGAHGAETFKADRYELHADGGIAFICNGENVDYRAAGKWSNVEVNE